MKIAGRLTSDDWEELRIKLERDGKDVDWEEAFTNFYVKRLNSRYLDPIRGILDQSLREGAGFSAVALFFTLPEYLESFELGKQFRYKAPRGIHEFGPKDATKLFKRFFSRFPFKSAFEGVDLDNFYDDVRCGLLHEARTKGNWRICSYKYKSLIFREGEINQFNRFQLIPIMEQYIEDYHARLKHNKLTQEAFIRKFNFLCCG